MEVNQIWKSSFEDLVFENKNKAYGAYEIRKKYNKNLSIGLGIAIGILVLVLVYPFIASLFEKKEVLKTEDVVTTVNKLAAPPPLSPKTPPPPEIKVPPPPKTIEFVAPVLKKNVVEVKEIPKIDSLKNQVVAAVTQKVEAPPSLNIPVTPPPPVVEDKPIDFVNVEQKPEFVGGEAAFYKYLQDHLKYPALAREAGIQGRVFIAFTVDKDGSIKDVQLLKGIGGGCDEEAMRIIKNMPAWKPGKQNGREIPVKHRLPIIFKLS